MVPIAKTFNVLRFFLKAIQNLGPNLPSKVDQDGNWKTKMSENFLEFTSIGAILQHGSGVARGDINQKLDVKPLAVVQPVIKGEVKKLVSDKETVLQVRPKGSNSTKFHITVTGWVALRLIVRP
jgi:hypothetical protein